MAAALPGTSAGMLAASAAADSVGPVTPRAASAEEAADPAASAAAVVDTAPVVEADIPAAATGATGSLIQTEQ